MLSRSAPFLRTTHNHEKKKCPQDSPRSGAQTPSPTYYRVCMQCINPNPLVRGQSRTASLCILWIPFQAPLTWTSGTYALLRVPDKHRRPGLARLDVSVRRLALSLADRNSTVGVLASCARSATKRSSGGEYPEKMRPQTTARTALSFLAGTLPAPIRPPVVLANLVTCD